MATVGIKWVIKKLRCCTETAECLHKYTARFVDYS